MGVYDDRPELARVALHPEDVEVLLLTDGAELASQPRLVRHLLTRMRATFAAHAETERSLRRDLDQLAEGGKRRANKVTAALDALAALSLEEQRLVFDRRAEVLVDSVVTARQEAAAARVAAASETNRARLVLAHVASSPALPTEAREVVAAALDGLPLMRQPVDGALPVPDGGFVLPDQVHDLSRDLFD